MPRQVYNRGTSLGEPHYECVDCAFDVQGSEKAIQEHNIRTGHGIVEDDMTENQFMMEQMKQPPPKGVIITLAYLCWNTAKASIEGAKALFIEATRLRGMGYTVYVAVLDNGSFDDTFELLSQVSCLFTTFIRFETNVGISKARNTLLQAAINNESEFILFMDGDIEVVPFSVHMMSRYLLCHPEVGCIGAYPTNFSRDRQHVAPILTEIPESRVHSDLRCACTQYGLFRVSLFRDRGVRFDEDGPMGKPGWGFEDDDLYWQIIQAGWDCRYFGGMTYLHRNLHSSWGHLASIGVSVQEMFDSRKAHILLKWGARGVPPGIIESVRSQHINVG